MVWQRVLGGVMVATGVFGLLLALVGVFAAPQIIGSVANDLDVTLEKTAASVAVVQDTLMLTKDTLADVNKALATVETTANDASVGMSRTGVLIDELGRVTGETVPGNLDAALGALPSLSQLARTVDQALTTLADFSVDTEILGFPIRFDLGIDYEAGSTLEQPLQEIGDSLDELAADLRGQTGNLAEARESVDVISADLAVLSQDLNAINRRLADYGPLLDQYLAMTDGISQSLSDARVDLQNRLRLARFGSILLFLWLGLVQCAPLYLGWELVGDRRPAQE